MSERGQNYRATWARWRERNATGWDAYEARMESADQCLATCPTCWAQCDLPEGHLRRHQFPGRCETVVLDETWTLSPEARRLFTAPALGTPSKIGGTIEVEYVSPLLAEAFRRYDDMRLAREWARDLFGGAE